MTQPPIESAPQRHPLPRAGPRPGRRRRRRVRPRRQQDQDDHRLRRQEDRHPPPQDARSLQVQPDPGHVESAGSAGRPGGAGRTRAARRDRSHRRTRATGCPGAGRRHDLGAGRRQRHGLCRARAQRLTHVTRHIPGHRHRSNLCRLDLQCAAGHRVRRQSNELGRRLPYRLVRGWHRRWSVPGLYR